jgi:hypothetical protein
MATTATRQAQEKSANLAGLSTGQSTAASTALSTPERRTPLGSAPEAASAASEKKAVGYGLPCSRCHAYYPADMHVCPICKSPDRVSPMGSAKHSTAPAAPQPASQLASQVASQVTSQVTTGAPVNISIDDDRERFLKELKSQAFALHTQVNAAATFRCVLQHQHHGASEPAAVCHTCYGEARQQADRLEAALHMDAKEAAKIVYDAVWADPSDPNRTYLNAAAALLSELRKRAGIGLLLGANQPLAD